MSTKPKFITFTGADDHTPIQGMLALSKRYPIEWGILFSPKRQGQGRYPTFGQIGRICAEAGAFRLSAHLCGGHSRELIETGAHLILEDMLENSFTRIQLNTADPSVNPDAIGAWAYRLEARAIIQCRDSFPSNACVDWLFDASGGRGIEPTVWPSPNGESLRGYAGGLNPKNVAHAVSVIGAMTNNYWIDMETGVRDANDRFDLGLCREVCEAVYGPMEAA